MLQPYAIFGILSCSRTFMFHTIVSDANAARNVHILSNHSIADNCHSSSDRCRDNNFIHIFVKIFEKSNKNGYHI